MANVLNAGQKIHLMQYTGVRLTSKGNVVLKKQREGRAESSCGRLLSGDHMINFSRSLKEYPEACCVKCTKKFYEWMDKAKSFKENQQ